ncbi:MAG: hypothetical protein ACE14L_04850 [Terriglobales bacterium]
MQHATDRGNGEVMATRKKNASYEALARRKQRSAEFFRRIGKRDVARELERESVQSYAERQGKQVNPRRNAGTGKGFVFHGAFTSKRAAAAKEARTPGSFIRPVQYRDGSTRYAVLVPRAANRRNGAGSWLRGKLGLKPQQKIKRHPGYDARTASKVKWGPAAARVTPPGCHYRPSGKAARATPHQTELISALRNLGYTPADAKQRAAAAAARLGPGAGFDALLRAALAKNPRVLLRDVQRAVADYASALQTWGEHNQITVRAAIRRHELEKAYAEQQARRVQTSLNPRSSRAAMPRQRMKPRASARGGADLKISVHGTVALITTHSSAGRRWAKDHIAAEPWQRMGDALVIEPRYAGEILDAAAADGLTTDPPRWRRANPLRRRNIPGFKDAGGKFHPIRGGKGYDPKLAGDVRRKRRAPKPRKRPAARRRMRREAAGQQRLFNPRRRSRRNPGGQAAAAELYEQFHGAPATEVIEVLEADDVPADVLAKVASMIPPEDYAMLGALVKLEIRGGKGSDAVEIEFRQNEQPKLVSNPEGTQLYFEGGNQDVSALLTATQRKKRLVDLGECTQLEYHTRKAADGFRAVTYYHELGEETGERPRLMFHTQSKRLYLVGGAYQVKPEGITN